MTDYFGLLNEPRRPWLDTTLLRRKFLALAASCHPDRVHQAGEAEKIAANRHYAELNAAWQCLSEPKTRLLHLLELERGAKPADIQTIPSALADVFAGVSEICRQADAFISDKEKVTSPLLKIQWFERAQPWIERLNSWQQNLGKLRDQLNSRLEMLDQQWSREDEVSLRDPALLARLEELYRFYGYFNRWQNQLQERVARLSF